MQIRPCAHGHTLLSLSAVILPGSLLLLPKVSLGDPTGIVIAPSDGGPLSIAVAPFDGDPTGIAVAPSEFDHLSHKTTAVVGSYPTAIAVAYSNGPLSIAVVPFGGDPTGVAAAPSDGDPLSLAILHNDRWPCRRPSYWDDCCSF
jgi:hypothetical protein